MFHSRFYDFFPFVRDLVYILVRLSWLGFLPCFSAQSAHILTAARAVVVLTNSAWQWTPAKAARGRLFPERGLLATRRRLPHSPANSVSVGQICADADHENTCPTCSENSLCESKEQRWARCQGVPEIWLSCGRSTWQPAACPLPCESTISITWWFKKSGERGDFVSVIHITEMRARAADNQPSLFLCRKQKTGSAIKNPAWISANGCSLAWSDLQRRICSGWKSPSKNICENGKQREFQCLPLPLLWIQSLRDVCG